MYFMILGTDAAGTSAVRQQVRPAHRAYLRDPGDHAVEVLLGGPTQDDSGERMNGTLLVVEANSLEEVERFVADDPYSRAGLFSSVVVRPWAWSLGMPEPDR